MRFEHSLGTLHVAHLMLEALERNHREPGRDEETQPEWRLGGPPTAFEAWFVRLGALLHDIGHIPAGHTLEDELALLTPHDYAERLNLIFEYEGWWGPADDIPAGERRPLGAVINKAYDDIVKAAGITRIDGTAATAVDVLLELISKGSAKARSGRQVDGEFDPRTLRNGNLRIGVCRDIIGNTICADLLDYLHRDWLHLGRPRYFETRLLDYLEIRTRGPAKDADARLVINLRTADNVRADAVTAIIDLLESRYQLAEMALYHRAKTCAAAMLERALAELNDAAGQALGERLKVLLRFSDAQFFQFVEDELGTIKASGADPARVSGARQLMRNLGLRRLHKVAYSKNVYTLAADAMAIQDLYASEKLDGAADDVGAQPDADEASVSEVVSLAAKRRQPRPAPMTEDKGPAAFEHSRDAATRRLNAMRLLELDFDLPAGSLVMYCPPRNMSSKIARVQVLLDRKVHRLDHIESKHGDLGIITGGHLRAQDRRFKRLWRVTIAIELTARARLKEKGLLLLFDRAIEWCVLGRALPPGITRDQAVRELAQDLKSRDADRFAPEQLANLEAAARSAAMTAYPSGAATLLQCLLPR